MTGTNVFDNGWSNKYAAPREDVKKSDTKQHMSYKYTTVSNIDELIQRKINITAGKIHKIYLQANRSVETPLAPSRDRAN